MKFKNTILGMSLLLTISGCSNVNNTEQDDLQLDSVKLKNAIYERTTVETTQAKVTVTNTSKSLSSECKYLSEKPIDKSWLLLCDQMAKALLNKYIGRDKYLSSKRSHFLFTQDDTIALVSDFNDFSYSSFTIKRSLTKKHKKSDSSFIEASVNFEVKTR